MTQRTERIDELLRQEITSLLTKEIADPRIGFATVTDVETTPDLRHARLSVSVIGQPADRTATVRALEHAMPFVRRELGRRLRLKRIPEFTVRLDDSIERGTRVLQLINELEAGGTPDELPEGESLPTPTVRMAREGDADDPAEPAPPNPRKGRRRTGSEHDPAKGSGGSARTRAVKSTHRRAR
jgi:ribosome-binding factor A